MSDMKTVRLINISKDRVRTIDPNAALISITDRYSNGVSIPNKDKRPLLQLEFFPRDYAPELDPEHCMTDERADAIIKFVDEQRRAGAEVIYVQCGEGRIRSFTICMALERLDGFYRDTDNCCIKNGTSDHYTSGILRKRCRAFEETQQ